MLSLELQIKNEGSPFLFTRQLDSGRVAGGQPSETIRRDREESKICPLEVLSVISPWNPLSTLSFHKENSAIAEGLVLLRDRFLEYSELVVLCF